MPLWSVQEWRARIGTSWCALGRPIRSKSSYRSRGNYLRSPPPGGGLGGGGRSGRRRAESCAHGAVTVVIMIALLVGTIVTLSHFALGGRRLIDACWFVCTPVDLLLVQWMLAMSLVTNGVSRFFSESWSLLCFSDSTGSFLSGFEAFPNSHRIYRIAIILFDIRIVEKNKRTDEQVVRGTLLRNFWQTFYGKMKNIRLSLVSAVVKASLLLRCGDVETNPGPVSKVIHLLKSNNINFMTIDDLDAAVESVWKIRAKWKDIGRCIGVDEGTLNTMKGSDNDCLRDMLTHWLRGVYKPGEPNSEPRTWHTLIEALRAREVNEEAMANKLEEEKYPDISQASSTDRYFLVGEKLIMETSGSGQTYQWLKDGNPIVNGQEYDGVNTPKLTVKNASSTSAGTYTCRVDRNVVDRFRQILTTSEEMKRAFQESGRITLNIAKILVTGGAGSGKTCTKKILYGKDPPTKHISTDLLEGEKPTYCEKLYLPTGEEFEKWTPAELNDILVMLRNGIMSKIKPKPRRQDSVVVNEDCADHVDHDDANDQSVLDSSPTGMLLQEIKEQGFGGRNLAEFHWVYFFDSAGQSEYLDIIPAFIKNVTVTMYVLDLTKPLRRNLQDNLGVEVEGESGQGENKESIVKGEQFLQMVLQTLQFQSKETKLMVVGTHRDMCNDQDVKDRNKEVHEIIDRIKCVNQNFDVVSHGVYDEQDIIFELCAIKDPPDHTQRTARDIRRKVGTKCSEELNIPITWFLCEEDLREKGDILTINECIPVAKRNRMNEKDLKEMLKRFHELNLLFYYTGDEEDEGDDLTNIVFTNPLIIMKIVSDIVKHARKSHSAEDLIPLTTRKTIRKRYVDEVIKQRSKKVEELIKLLEKRLILVKFPERDEYYMPCIFPVCENPSEAIKKKCHPNQANKQKLHTTFLIELDNGCAPRGIFYGLICHFLRCQYNLSDDSSNLELYRNLIHGNYRQNPSFQVSLVNSFRYFEVHVIGSGYDNLKCVCKQIRECLKKGLEAAYEQFYEKQDDIVPVPVRFLCSATEDCLKSPHMAEFPEVGKPRELICSQNRSVTYELDPEHLAWLNEGERKDASAKAPTIESLNNPNKTVDHGKNLELSVVCNDANIKYQWQHKRDGVPTDLENNNPHYDKVDELKLTVKNAQEEQAGDYFCKVENLAGYSTTSEYFHVTVRLGELPTIEPLNNRNKIIDHGENLELSVVCNDANIEYQWQYYFKDKDTTDLKNNPHYNQVDESTLIIRNAQKQHTGYYCCKVKNLAGYSTSEYFHVTVQDFRRLICLTVTLVAAIIPAVILIILSIVLGVTVLKAAASVIVAIIAPIVMIVGIIISYVYKPELIDECVQCCGRSCRCCRCCNNA